MQLVILSAAGQLTVRSMHTVHGTIRGSCWKARVRLTHGVETTKDIFDLFLSPFNYTVSSYGSFSSYGVTKRLVMKLNIS